MNIKARLEQWKKTPITENVVIDGALFKQIVKSAKRIENRTFGFKISKSTILKNFKHGRITAFNGFRCAINGDQACYRLSRTIGIGSEECESITLLICL